MNRFIISIFFIFLTISGFAQQPFVGRTIGAIPHSADANNYQIQVGAFRDRQNAERSFERIRQASMNPSYEQFQDFTRVVVKGISAGDVPLYLERLRSIGFNDAIIRIDAERQIAVTLPPAALREVANRVVRIGETRSLTDLVTDRNVTSWISSTPSVRIDANGNISGQSIGNSYIRINENEYISIAVVPNEEFYILPESETALLPANTRTSSSSSDNITEYRSEPTYRLAYRFNNRNESRGASGTNGGIDILGRGSGYTWLLTTFMQGGWFYDLNGVQREMVNGLQRGSNGVTLTIKPEFVYDKGVPYLQLRHLLHNTNNFPVTEQKFGASADVMIHNNDDASVILTPYGAYMTDSRTNPSIELMLICLSGNGITPVSTLWLGGWMGGEHLNYIYNDAREDVHGIDSAIGFSYQNINLNPGETKEFIIRFTLARNED